MSNEDPVIPETKLAADDGGSGNKHIRIGLDFSDGENRGFLFAQEEAQRLEQFCIGTEHILLALFRYEHGLARKALMGAGLDLESTRLEVKKLTIGSCPQSKDRELPFTPRARRVLEMAWDEFRDLKHTVFGSEHLLLGLLRQEDGMAARVFDELGIDKMKLRTQLFQLMRSGN